MFKAVALFLCAFSVAKATTPSVDAYIQDGAPRFTIHVDYDTLGPWLNVSAAGTVVNENFGWQAGSAQVLDKDGQPSKYGNTGLSESESGIVTTLDFDFDDDLLSYYGGVIAHSPNTTSYGGDYFSATWEISIYKEGATKPDVYNVEASTHVN
ncbi:hypothetical protein OGAPHI_002169 [Ogataea philodendri]|uniref:Uncharacterized protein n=1 Tax=Ogataea philodendri TaxID=1378263 RepID=A0A9P8PAY3_9ASCO|nr:uncharacterized protein OGAPHI_002169 [Ogataea philodendri]KAH3668415.1 hypothetical protein OGAPHI_002169 [Ogataea philodendri]